MVFQLHQSVESPKADNLARTMWAWSLTDDRVQIPTSDSVIANWNASIDVDVRQAQCRTAAALRARVATHMADEYPGTSPSDLFESASQKVVQTGLFGLTLSDIEQYGSVPWGAETHTAITIINDLDERLVIEDDQIEAKQ